ncbi:MAG: metal ABC transporter permease [Roseovarius sp.]|nr:metal ABC transporter permease [Roseovarius sp.]
MNSAEFISLSLPPILIGSFAAIACALPGNFLLLRRQALISDAISHVVLPGIVVAFIATGTISTWPIMAGAAIAAFISIALIDAIRRMGGIESGAAMGVVFSAMFAFGVLLLEMTNTSSIHLDVEHALYGNLESLVWFEGQSWASLLSFKALAGLPPELPRMAIILLIIALLTRLFWRPLKISTFDDGFARTLGLPTGIIGLSLMGVATIAAVGAFDAVGSIIVISMFICPPSAARMMTNRLEMQIAWSVAFAIISAVLGYVLAGYGPLWLGLDNAVSAAGMIATVSGLILAMTAIAGPCRKRAGVPALSSG